MLKSAPFSTRPLYLQVRDLLASRIAAGDWRPGGTLPNEVELARELNVSPGTVRKALDQMEDEHLVFRRQGRGTFVADQSSEELAVRFTNIRTSQGSRISGHVSGSKVTVAKASELEQRRLRLRAHADVIRILRMRRHQEQPFMIEEVSLPEQLFPGLVDRSPISHRITLLAQQFGLLLGKAQEQVRIGTADAMTAKELAVSEGAPLLELDRVVYALDGRPVEWRLAKCHFVDQVYCAEME
jgi:GntR family transcriptional regulator